MNLITTVLIAVLLVAFFVTGNFFKFSDNVIRYYRQGKIIYVDKKHMNITVEGCATPSLTLGFDTPIKASFLRCLIRFSRIQQ